MTDIIVTIVGAAIGLFLAWLAFQVEWYFRRRSMLRAFEHKLDGLVPLDYEKPD